MKPAASKCYRRLYFGALVLAMLALLAGGVISIVGKTYDCGPRTADPSNLRQLGQASLIYAYDHKDQFPQAVDVWDYAFQLAESVGVNEPRMWLSKLDPAYPDSGTISTSSILDREITIPRKAHPQLRETKPSVAVVLGKLNMTMPATTPLLWTRGLQPDGTWAQHSPYGNRGGHIMFMGGNVAYFTDIKANDRQLTRFDGKGTTSNILEALPPGCRIGEYEPTPEEKTEWARINRERAAAEKRRLYAPLIFIALIWLPFIALSIYRGVNKRPGCFTVLLWPILILILASILIPGLWHIGSMH